MEKKIFIPKKCKVGFNLRTDTYTGKLGYIIPWDGKQWRKLTGWENWREKHMDEEEFQRLKFEDFSKAMNRNIDSWERYRKSHTETSINPEAEFERLYGTNYNKGYYGQTKEYHIANLKKNADEWLSKYPDVNKYLISARTDKVENYSFQIAKRVNNPTVAPIEFENEPTEGFVLNKRVGGGRSYSSWDHARETKCRIYDPRGFEFEITIENLLWILESTSSIKGKGLEGNFVYGWNGKDLVLIPESAPEYQEMIEFTKIQDFKISSGSLEPGRIYHTKKQGQETYLGKFPEWKQESIKNSLGKYTGETRWVSSKPKFWFASEYGISARTGIQHLATPGEMDSDYAKHVAKMEKMNSYSPIDKYVLEDPSEDFLEKCDTNYHWTVQMFFEHDGELFSFYHNNYYKQINHIKVANKYFSEFGENRADILQKFGLHNGSQAFNLRDLVSKLNLKQKVAYLKNGNKEE